MTSGDKAGRHSVQESTGLPDSERKEIGLSAAMEATVCCANKGMTQRILSGKREIPGGRQKTSGKEKREKITLILYARAPKGD